MVEINLICVKKLPLDEQNEFYANLSKSNEIGEVFKKVQQASFNKFKKDYKRQLIDVKSNDKVENEKI